MARLRIADLEIEAPGRIRQGGNQLPLSPTEHIVLYALAEKRGAVVPYAALAAALGFGRHIRANTLARHMTSLRRKLGDRADRPQYIETVKKVGYRFVV